MESTMTKTYEDLSQNVVVASPANRLSATRRATLAGMVGSLAAPVTASAATVGHGADAGLIAVCCEFDDLERLRLSYSWAGNNHTDDQREQDEAYVQIGSRQAPLVERLCRLKATTEACISLEPARYCSGSKFSSARPKTKRKSAANEC